MSDKYKYWLSSGAHQRVEDGRCAMEWVSYLAGEPHSDQPVCVSPMLRAFCISLNDSCRMISVSDCGRIWRGRSGRLVTGWMIGGGGCAWTG